MTLVVKLTLLTFIFVILFSCQQDEKLIHLSGKTMGTTYNVKYIRNSTITISDEDIQKFINLKLEAINLGMSTYIHESELSQFNRIKSKIWFKISKDFLKVLKFSYNLAEDSNGLYDPTIGPLVNLWGFGPKGPRNTPSKSEVKLAKNLVGFHHIKFKDSSIYKSIDELKLDLSSTAKGFGVDKIAELLSKLTISNFMVEIGGELVTQGKKNGKNWMIGIEYPDIKNIGNSLISKIASKNYAIATSGNYRNFYKKDGIQYSHIINSKTGYPVKNSLLSVTVISKIDCMNADGYATALMVMGKDQAIKFANAKNLNAFFIYNENGKLKTLKSKSLKKIKML